MNRVNKKRILLYAAVIGLLIFIFNIGWLRPIENVVTTALNPVLGKIHSLSLGWRDKYSEQADREDLATQIRQLQKQTNSLIAENAKLKILEEENRILRQNLRFLSQQDQKYIMSNVISRGDLTDTSGYTRSIIIDRGENDGLRKGLVVVDDQGVVVGKIAATKGKIAQVILTSNPECKLAATILNDANTSGIAEGELGLTISMGFIPQTNEIKVNDIVVTSGLEETIPRGLVIGRVTAVARESNELWQRALLEPLSDPNSLIIVSVLLP